MTAQVVTTQWSQVLAARDGSDTEARVALEDLCQTYWQPLYAYIRHQGVDPDEARDLTQGFFTELLEKNILADVDPAKGRFRAYLLALRIALLVLLVSSLAAPGSSQTVPDRVFRDVDGNPLPFQSDEEAEEFLRTAEVTSQRDIGTGVTKPKQLVLEKDGLTVHAAFNYVDKEGEKEKLGGSTEMYFLDSYKADIAAYKLSRLLGMKMIPPSVERQVGLDKGVVRLWIEDLESYDDWIDDGNTGTPDSLYLRRQLKDQITFDLLIRNIDRNRGNINWDLQKNLWLIDQTRSLARVEDLPKRETKTFKGCSRALFEAMDALELEEVKSELHPYVGRLEIKALMKRRDKLVKHIKSEIKQEEGKILFNYTDPPKGLVIKYDDE